MADSALKMEAVCISEMLTSTCQSKWRQNPEEKHSKKAMAIGIGSYCFRSVRDNVLRLKELCKYNITWYDTK
jgi:hypothetical protein